MNLLFWNIWNECDPFICYSGVFSSIREIFHENGILGFFSGIVPRILGEIASTVIASTLTFIVNSYLVNDKDLKKFTASSMAVSACFYQVVKKSETFTCSLQCWFYTLLTEGGIVSRRRTSASPLCCPPSVRW